MSFRFGITETRNYARKYLSFFLHRNRSSSRERIAYNHCSDQQGDTEKRLVTRPAREIDMSNVTFRCIFLQINLNIDIPSRDIKLIIFPSLKFFRTDVISRGHLLLLLLSQKCLLFLSTSHNRVESNSNIHFYEDRNMQSGE